MATTISLTPEQLATLSRHLFQGEDEQVAFALATWEPNGAGGVFGVEELELIPPEGFAFQSDYHIELSSETQARLIKSAFDRRASLIEFHSHRTRWPACFSGSDFHGFDEFVPHVRWRLAGRPYAAVVFAESSFDALAWVGDKPVQLDSIQAGNAIPQSATGLSLSRSEHTYEP